MNDADFPVTSSVVQLMSADKKVSADTLRSVTNIVQELEAEAKASVLAAAKYYGRKASDAKRKKQKRRAAGSKKPDISILPFIDSDSKKVRKRPAVEKTGDLFGQSPADGWPDDYAVQFWDRWPRHFRKYAQKAVAAKLGRIRKNGEASWDQVFNGLAGYLASNPETKWIPAPEVWLNKQRWLADYSTVNTGRKMTFGDIMRGGIARHG